MIARDLTVTRNLVTVPDFVVLRIFTPSPYDEVEMDTEFAGRPKSRDILSTDEPEWR